MTAQQARDRLLAWAAMEIGYCEKRNNWTKYAALPAVTRLLGWDAQNQPWCNVFVLAGFVSCFGLEDGAAMLCQPIGGGSALCRQSAQFFRDAGAWYDRLYMPEAGDIVFFYVGGEINHMGIVERCNGGGVQTIEGNAGDCVAERMYSVNDQTIAGYGRPRWKLAEDANVHLSEKDAGTLGSDPISDPEPVSGTEGSKTAVSGFPATLPTLRVGMGGAWVAALQGILFSQSYNLGPCGVDGDYGVCTRSAVLNFQTRHGLDADGVVGPRTWAALVGQ